MINNNTNKKIAIKKKLIFFELYIIIVISFVILIIVTRQIEIAIAITIRVVVNFVNNIDSFSSIIVIVAFQIVYFVYINIFCIFS